MSEDLVKQLSSYKAQLQQVEAALSTDQENEDLLKLQKDLQVHAHTPPHTHSTAQNTEEPARTHTHTLTV